MGEQHKDFDTPLKVVLSMLFSFAPHQELSERGWKLWNGGMYPISKHLISDFTTELGARRREIKDVFSVVFPSRNPWSRDDARHVCHWSGVLSVKPAAVGAGCVRVVSRWTSGLLEWGRAGRPKGGQLGLERPPMLRECLFGGTAFPNLQHASFF